MLFSDPAKVKMLFSSEIGKEVLEDICLVCGIDKVSFKPGDPTLTAYQEGARAVALALLMTVHGEIRPTEVLKPLSKRRFERMKQNV